jgi:SAM-dependent methyltransferase
MQEFEKDISGIGPVKLYTPNVCLPWIEKQRTGLGDFWDKIIVQEWEPIKDAVNWDKVGAVLDIGAGVGGIDVLLWHKCRPILALMDYDKTADRLKYGMQASGEPYNSIKATVQMMKRNGVEGVEYYSPDNLEAFGAHSYGLILSCLSWGYHYPIETYLYQAKHALNPSGAIIIDIRENTREQWRGLVEANFNEWEVIARGNKREKVVMRGPKL